MQGTAADLMKLAMLRVLEALLGGIDDLDDARMLLQVHDELLLEVPEDDIDVTAKLVSDAMQSVHPMEVPLLVDVKTGMSWRDVT